MTDGIMARCLTAAKDPDGDARWMRHPSCEDNLSA